MTIDERIVQILVPGTIPALYPLVAPDETRPPYTTYHLFDAEKLTTLTAALATTRMWHCQFSTFSPVYGTTRTISNAVQDRMVGYTDTFIMGVTALREQPAWDDIAKLYCWMLELLVMENLTA